MPCRLIYQKLTHIIHLGKPESYEEARVIMAGIAGAFIDREVETRGFDFIDTEKAKRQARKNIDEVPPSSNGW